MLSLFNNKWQQYTPLYCSGLFYSGFPHYNLNCLSLGTCGKEGKYKGWQLWRVSFCWLEGGLKGVVNGYKKNFGRLK